MHRISVVFLIILLASCAATGPFPPPPKPSAKPLPESQTAPAQPQRPAGPLPPSARPTYNLGGYPPATKEGYIDGCETAKKTRYGYKDEQRYRNDGQYRMGWDDGFAICRGKR
ncbi:MULTISPECIES: hypothetical protein [unclassified Nitrosomonas]|jgi:hypothetical protein|uniref:hypothetical protein n=1 Tax=unclassified Nitrosomonas TaxID=2609265 RepID=UPI000882D11B|nr:MULTISPECIES: hypothetical protein [unclassified Nitrosomonas]SDH82377.1 hypothetical protein SAMN05428952_103427 [Nitrosomonas sp. Nm132]SDY58827.1 hypothetical protein SAMN05421754_101413 [Nitrosomonas sp. Nm58]